MEIKKYPHAVLENYSKILIQLGLVLSLFITDQFINMKSYPSEIKDLVGSYVQVDDMENSIEIKPIEILEPSAPKIVISERILKVDDQVEIQETIIESTEIDETDAVVVKLDKEIKVVEEEDEVVEDVPFRVIGLIACTVFMTPYNMN